MRFCPDCGAPLELRIPPDDHRERHVCPACAAIHYINPKLIVGAIPEWEDGRILLCKRAIEPRLGLWTLPAGFMELGETSLEGAARETLEEANARVEIGDLYALFNLPHINQVQLLFRARLLDLVFSPGAESQEVKLLDEGEIPWEELAFRPVRITLQRYFEERRKGAYSFAVYSLEPPSK